MATEKQIAANQANSLKSTGPITEAGKAASSLNAMTHGCTSQTIILPGEDIHLYRNFHQSFFDDFRPKGALEQSMVQNLVQIQWAMSRMHGYQANLFALGHVQNADRFPSNGDQAIQAAITSAVIVKEEAPSVKNMGLYLQRANRAFLNMLKEIRKIQAERRAAEQVELDLAIYCAALHALDEIPFVPTQLGFVCSTEEIAPLVRRKIFLLTHAAPKKRPEPPQVQVKNAA